MPNEKKGYIFAADIGGTNARFGIFKISSKKLKLLKVYNYKTKKIKNIYGTISKILSDAENNYNAEISKACFGIAGAVDKKRNFVKLTNAQLIIDTKKIKRKNNIKNLILLNDFEALGYGINLLKKSDFITIKKGVPEKSYPIALIGAGTGLGKAILIYDKYAKAYVPLSSEGGHSDFPIANDFEMDLIRFIKKFRKIKNNVFIEDLVSGRGIENIYYFLKCKKKYKNKDKLCKDNFLLFSKYYARALRNFALEVMALGGIYISGGISINNPDIFDKSFIREFENNSYLSKTLKKIPIYLIKDENIGLAGAAFALLIK